VAVSAPLAMTRMAVTESTFRAQDGFVRRLTGADAPRLAEAAAWPENRPMLTRNARDLAPQDVVDLARALLAGHP